jgi:hypothetical protein
MLYGFNIFVQVAEPIDVEILRYKPDVTIREWLQFVLRSGCNPRVYAPLPHGFEAKVGLDAFGNDLPGYDEQK